VTAATIGFFPPTKEKSMFSDEDLHAELVQGPAIIWLDEQ
jgi:hypothetical protein